MVEAMGRESDQLPPIGREDARYLRTKRVRLTDSSYRSYEFCLEKFVRHCGDLELEDFEPPAGTERLEAHINALWGSGAPRTFNKNLSIIKDFFRWQVKQGHLKGDPTVLIERARSREVYRPTYSPEQRRAILSNQDSLRDTIALRLLLDYGLRKGALQAVQFKHFDRERQRLTIFTKGREGPTDPDPPSSVLGRPRAPHPERQGQVRALPHVRPATGRARPCGGPSGATDERSRSTRLVVSLPREGRRRV
jgi:integrase